MSINPQFPCVDCITLSICINRYYEPNSIKLRSLTPYCEKILSYITTYKKSDFFPVCCEIEKNIQEAHKFYAKYKSMPML